VANNEFKGMSERDLLILTYTGMQKLEEQLEGTSKRLGDLERFKLEIETRVRTFLWVISISSTALGSIISFIIQHFVK
jgi:hypothetical protein